MAPGRVVGQDRRVALRVPGEGQADLRRGPPAGKLQTRQWDDKDGNTRYTTEVRGDRVVLLGGAGGAARQQARAAGAAGAAGPAGMDEPMGEPATELTDDDIPF